MKKTLLLLILTVFLTACSSDDDGGSSSNSNSSINPPEWIQGTWLLDAGSANSGFLFKNDDFCQVINNTNSCYKENIRLSNQSGAETNITQEVSDDYYFLEITIGPSVVTFEFEKISENEIRRVNFPTNGFQQEVIYIKQ